MKNLLKNNKGSMAVYVTVTILCFMLILTGIFFMTASIRKNQLRTLPKIKEAYEQDLDNIQEVYEEQENLRKIEGGSFNASKGVNTPDLADGALTPIIWDETANNGQGDWVATSSDDPNWYSYTTTDKKWANARTSDGSMWVWIPRFAYQISEGYHQSGADIDPSNATNSAGTVNIKFMKGTTNEAADGTTTWDNTSGEGNWNIHPAFQYNGTKAGIWVAKFEASSTIGNTNTVEGDNVTTKTLQVKPGVQSWRHIDIGNAFTVCQNYNTSLNSHMMKNSEWGAVAYLSKSSYGVNEEIAINSNNNYLTGGGSENAYANNARQSTTGTIYGIYDMSGGSYEYIAAYVNNENSNLNTYGSSLISAAGYMKDVYEMGSGDTREANYAANSGIYGDAVYEISSGTSSPYENSWYGDYSSFPYSSWPFFYRGGIHNNGTVAGIFYFNCYYGYADILYGFRPVLIPMA